jgi:decaprenylphospho-beta-D-ribofuranose 2-oxidase
MFSPLSSPRMRALVSLIVRMVFTRSTCVLFAIGSVILGLVWVLLDFFGALAGREIFSWLPLIVLLVVMALLMSEKWLAALFTMLLVMAALAGLFALLLVLGLLVFLPAPLIAISGALVLIGFNGSVFWVTRNVQRCGNQEQQKVRLRRRLLVTLPKTALAAGIGVLFGKAYFWDDPSRQWLLQDLLPHSGEAQKLSLAPPLAQLLQDASNLQSSVIHELRSPMTVAEVVQAVTDARSTHRKISLSGIRHSMGGQALGSNTLHLDMTHLDQVVYNEADQTVTVGPGATWKQIQTILSPRGRAVRVMQDSNIFSIGGSLSVNAHGKDPRYGSLIEGVNFLKVVMADGQEIQCDRTHQPDLFAAVIGGYGILGIITQANLQTTRNSTYLSSLMATSTDTVIEKLEALGKNPANRLLEAHLSVDNERFLTESLIYLYSEDNSLPPLADDLQAENSIWLRKVIFQASRTSNMGKVIRWELEKRLTPLVDPRMISRNTAMAVPVRFLQNPDSETTDLLQEYFVPTGQVAAFLARYKQLLKKHRINLLNVTLRKVVQDTSALVSYAHTDMYGLVVYYKVARTPAGVQSIQAFTRELVEYLIAIDARYYLCYGAYSTPAQLDAMYPQIRTLFALKAHYDPETLFTNQWYELYREDLAPAPVL